MATQDAPAREWLRSDRIAGLLLALLGVAVAVESLDLPLGTLANPGAAFAPLILAGILAVLGVLTLLAGGDSPGIGALDWSDLPHGAKVIAGAAFAALALEPLGYRLTMLALMLGFLGVVERRSLPATLLVSFGMAFGTYWLFADVLKTPLPIGPLGF
jgi:hypothetical protein